MITSMETEIQATFKTPFHGGLQEVEGWVDEFTVITREDALNYRPPAFPLTLQVSRLEDCRNGNELGGS